MSSRRSCARPAPPAAAAPYRSWTRPPSASTSSACSANAPGSSPAGFTRIEHGRLQAVFVVLPTPALFSPRRGQNDVRPRARRENMAAWGAVVGDRHAFGASLRRARLRAGVTLNRIADETNVAVTVWESLEDGELYGWPNGVFARAMISDYARLAGVDPIETLNQFCRLFPNG